MGTCIYLFSFMIPLRFKFTGIFDVILVNCEDVYLYCTVFVLSVFGRLASRKKDFYCAYVAKLCKAKLIQSVTSRDKCNIYLNENAA